MLKVHSKPHFALPPNVGHWQQNVDFNVVDVASEIYATDGYSGDGGKLAENRGFSSRQPTLKAFQGHNIFSART